MNLRKKHMELGKFCKSVSEKFRLGVGNPKVVLVEACRVGEVFVTNGT